MTTALLQNRESWLEKATLELQERVFKQHHSLPPSRVSIGFPGGRNPKKAIGQHWHPRASSDNVSQIFISPIHKTSLEHLGTLAHELVHACVPEAGHGKDFRKIALAIGLEGKMRSTTAGPKLIPHLQGIVESLGEIPHATLSLQDRPTKKQTTRMIKCECSACGYIARTSSTWIVQVGAPLCPCNSEPMELPNV